MKRCPKGIHAATPHLPGPSPRYIVDGKRLSKIMVRAYERHLRWVRYRETTPRRGLAVRPVAQPPARGLF